MKIKSLAILMLALLIALTGCEGVPVAYNNDTLADDTVVITPEPTLGAYTGPEVTALPDGVQAEYSMETKTMFWPEEAAESTADYMMVLEYPVFADAALNAPVDLYREELIDRVVNELIPYADRAEGEDVPATYVTCEVSHAGNYVNLIFNETERFGGNVSAGVCTVVMDESGAEKSFYEASGLYAPEDIAAQQIYNIIDREPERYHGDITQADIKLALDLYNGFIVTDTGYTLFVRPGLLAPEEEGIQSFSFTRAALYPLFVGEAVSVAQYEKLLPGLVALAGSLAEGYEGFDESPTALIATDFMTRMLIKSAQRMDGGWSALEKADYDAYFAACFTGAYPSDITAGDGTYFDGDTVYIPNTKKAVYGLVLDDARVLENGLMLTGVVMYGEPGSLESGEVAAVELTVAEDTASPMGFKIITAQFR